MNSRSKKTGGAYRYAKQRSTLHAKKGKDRGKSRGQYNTQTVTHNGWMAHQDIRKKEVWVCNNKGKKVTAFMPEEPLTADQLKEYIIYSQKVISNEEDICL